MRRTTPSLCGAGTLTHGGNFRAGCQSEQAGYIAGIPFSGGVAEWLKAHAWKACIRETVSWVRIPLPPPKLYQVISLSNFNGMMVSLFLLQVQFSGTKSRSHRSSTHDQRT